MTDNIDLDLERSYLATARKHWDLGYGEISSLMFFDLRHQVIFDVMKEIASESTTSSAMSFQSIWERIRIRGVSVQSGGDVYVHEVLTCPVELGFPKEPIERLKALAASRILQKKINEVLRLCNPENILEATDAIRGFAGLQIDVNSKFTSMTMHETVETTYKEIFDTTEKKKRIEIGTAVLGEIIGSLGPGEMMVIGGYTSSGKSQVARMLAMRQSLSGNHPGIISCEDAPGIWGRRIISDLSGVRVKQFYGKGEDDRRLWNKLHNSTESTIENSKRYNIDLLYLIGRPGNEAVGAVNHLVKNCGCNIIYLDYIQALRVDLKVSRYDKAISDIAKSLKGACYQAGVPLILLSQLSRPKDGDVTKRPSITSLKESGDLENEAEVVMLLWPNKIGSDAETMGAIEKLKWGTRGSVFRTEKHPETGMVVDLSWLEK
jgi:replicative DNA helicase